MVKLSFLYVLAANTTSIEILSLESAGNAKHISTLDISGPTKAAGITISTYSVPRSSAEVRPFVTTDRNNLQGMTTFVTQ